MSKYLTLYDVTGIQEFIFVSNKAKENIGGSIYVQELFEKILMNCLPDNSEKEWENATELKIIDDNSIKSEVIYIGGGNAMVIFDSESTAIETTKKLSKQLLEDTQATLGVAVAYQEIDFTNFLKEKDEVYKELNKNKSSFIQSTPLRGIGITKESSDGLPISGNKKDKTISDVANMKRDKTEKSDYYNDLAPNNYKFPKNFDDLGRMEGESHIAVIHIDGNSMGAFIDAKLSGIEDYKIGVKTIRDISKKLNSLYKEIFRKMVEECSNAIKDKNVSSRLNIKNNNLPIRPIILNGDDVTFVCDGRIAIQLASRFLEILSNTKLELDGKEEVISACAGIAIVKSHFPFYKAYELAEELCLSAKKKAKYFNKEDPGNWMDYHIVYSGFQTDLNAMRKEQYNVPGMKEVTRDVENKYSQYNLLLRPFCVTGKADAYYQWHNMTKLYKEMIKIPRSRLKDLRNGFISSEKSVKMQQEQNSSRGYNLPKVKIRNDISSPDDNTIFTDEKQTPYFEPLELLDFYIPEFKLEGEKIETNN